MHKSKDDNMMTKVFPFILVTALFVVYSCSTDIGNYSQQDRYPEIFPDYNGIVIPPNIAPLNFVIKEKGDVFIVNIYAEGADPITIKNSNGLVKIDIVDWHNLLQNARGKEINMDVYAKDSSGKLLKYKTITNQVSEDEIDNHLVYRLINTGYVMWSAMGIYQRNLENFDESVVVDNKTLDNTCINCHSFAKNNPKNMMFHVRSKHSGTVIYRDGNLHKINTKTNHTLAAGAYPNWHPDGRHIAMSVNKISQRFFSRDIRIEVSDAASDLVVYDVQTNKITTSPQVSTDSRENLPVWSADGKYLYFISAPPVTDYESEYKAKYELLRIPYDVENETWGTVDTVISSKETGKSISFPKISPDGKYLLFTMSDYGYFTIHHPDADIYLLNLENGKYEKLDINSPQTDSYHCWSSSGRWFVFSSKRLDKLFTRPFFCYFDKNGKVSKPFVMPQEDPEFYDTFLKNYNIPELVTSPVEPSPFDLRDLIMTDAIRVKISESVDTTFTGIHLMMK
jgi:hypothetical protein